VDVRGIDEASLAETAEAIVEAARRIAASEGREFRWRPSRPTPPFDGSCGHRDDRGRLPPIGIRLPAHAQRRGHDAMNMARIASAGMIFIHAAGYQPQSRRVRLTRGHRAGHGCAHGDARRAGGVTSSRQLVDGR